MNNHCARHLRVTVSTSGANEEARKRPRVAPYLLNKLRLYTPHGGGIFIWFLVFGREVSLAVEILKELEYLLPTWLKL